MRQPYNILLIPYILNTVIQYAVFKRSDGEIIQFIAGGVENEELNIEAAKREAYEEAGISKTSKFIPLESTYLMPADIFKEFRETNIDQVREISFAVELKHDLFKLSHEHDYYEWVSYEKALALLTFESNKLALMELNTHLIEL